MDKEDAPEKEEYYSTRKRSRGGWVALYKQKLKRNPAWVLTWEISSVKMSPDHHGKVYVKGKIMEFIHSEDNGGKKGSTNKARWTILFDDTEMYPEKVYWDIDEVAQALMIWKVGPPKE